MALVTCPCAFRLGRLAQSMPREFVCYCSIAVPCIWYIDFLPPTLFGVSFRRIFSQQTALSVCQYTQQSLSFVVVPIRSVFVLSERAAFFNLSINIPTCFWILAGGFPFYVQHALLPFSLRQPSFRTCPVFTVDSTPKCSTNFHCFSLPQKQLQQRCTCCAAGFEHKLTTVLLTFFSKLVTLIIQHLHNNDTSSFLIVGCNPFFVRMVFQYSPLDSSLVPGLQ